MPSIGPTTRLLTSSGLIEDIFRVICVGAEKKRLFQKNAFRSERFPSNLPKQTGTVAG